MFSGLIPLVFALGLSQIVAEPTLQERADFAQCIETQDDEACIDLVTSACFDSLEAETPDGVLACIEREKTLWETLVAQRYEALQPSFEDQDNAAQDSELALRRDQLAASQSFWAQMAENDCGYEAAAFRVEILARTTAMECLRIRTAERAIWLGRQLATP